MIEELNAIQPLSETEEHTGKKDKKEKHKRSPAFISYPAGHKGHPNAGVEVKLSSDELFSILFGPNSDVGVSNLQLFFPLLFPPNDMLGWDFCISFF